MTPNDEHLAIRKAFGFTLIDLQANQRGELSPRQQSFMKELHPPRREWFWWLMIFIMPLFLIVIVMSGLFPLERILIRMIARLPFILTLLLSLMIAIYKLRSNYRLKTRKVHTKEGSAELKQGFRGGNFYTLLLDKKEFRLIQPEEYQIIQPGARYRIYFIDTLPPIILSLEPVPA